MKNKLIDLNNHLFSQLERLSDEELTGEKLSTEIERAKSIACVAGHIVNNARLALDAAKAITDKFVRKENMPEMICDRTKIKEND